MPGRSAMHSEAWWARNPPNSPVIRCTARLKRDGSQCRNIALTGTNVCKTHGGLTPAVQQAAATRIGMSVLDAVKRLQGMLDDPAVEPREKVKILHDLLNRGGLGATEKHLVIAPPPDKIESLFRDLFSAPGNNFVDPDATATRDPATLPRYDEDGRVLADAEDIVDAEIVDEYAPTVRTAARGTERPSPALPAAEPPLLTAKTPKHIRESLATLI